LGAKADRFFPSAKLVSDTSDSLTAKEFPEVARADGWARKAAADAKQANLKRNHCSALVSSPKKIGESGCEFPNPIGTRDCYPNAGTVRSDPIRITHYSRDPSGRPSLTLNLKTTHSAAPPREATGAEVLGGTSLWFVFVHELPTKTPDTIVLVQREMESERAPLERITPFSVGQFATPNAVAAGGKVSAETVTRFKKEIRLGGPDYHRGGGRLAVDCGTVAAYSHIVSA
jgi:hypothetical protein